MSSSEVVLPGQTAPFVLGVAGATGSGKSTLAYGLQDLAPDNVTVLHLDDYFVPEAEMPELAGYKNWDDPRSVRYEQFAADLASLIAGQAIEVDTKNIRLNPDYYQTHQYKTVTVEPRSLIVVDGFLLLHYAALRELLNKSIYLDAPFEVYNNRRVHPAEENYRLKVIKPMVERYVLPSAMYADVVIDVSTHTPAEVLSQAVELLPDKLLLL